MGFIKKLFARLNAPSNASTTTTKSPEVKLQRRYLKDVKVGERIKIEWHKIIGGIGEPSYE